MPWIYFVSNISKAERDVEPQRFDGKLVVLVLNRVPVLRSHAENNKSGQNELRLNRDVDATEISVLHKTRLLRSSRLKRNKRALSSCIVGLQRLPHTKSALLQLHFLISTKGHYFYHHVKFSFQFVHLEIFVERKVFENHWNEQHFRPCYQSKKMMTFKNYCRYHKIEGRFMTYLMF